MITLQFIPYSEIEALSSIGRIRKLLNITKENKIVLLEGRLKKEEEKELIRATMEEINEEFKGIELAVIEPGAKKYEGFEKIKKDIVQYILGDRAGLTIIGPANIVKEIKKDPSKIELMTKEEKPKQQFKKKGRR